MQLTEEMILDAVDNLKARQEFTDLNMDVQDEISLYLTQLAADLRNKLND